MCAVEKVKQICETTTTDIKKNLLVQLSSVGSCEFFFNQYFRMSKNVQ